MASENRKRSIAEYGTSISHALHTWVHNFRALHGEVYVVALEVDDACLALSAVANTEAHYRRATSGIDDPQARARRRWCTEYWVPTDSGPEFNGISGVLRGQAWQPTFESFREMVFDSMLVGIQSAARRGVFGRRNRDSGVCLFLSTGDRALKDEMERRSAIQLNVSGEASEFLRYLDSTKAP